MTNELEVFNGSIEDIEIIDDAIVIRFIVSKDIEMTITTSLSIELTMDSDFHIHNIKLDPISKKHDKEGND